ncbi:hypothetical protein [Helicobacter zhangjianzhongii]|uniref:Uncharacterized protein n=1 Tax=Helicobacter zhangjianzhongii TaxID=2974574 RepID=A0ACC6FTQ4_9HELI|nr:MULTISPECIES: hypothetical protein [unclassified Helicobacter]MDL0080252.1 hypothetical protein [Helicobacter sp. CPD2-1]MDL0082313.1 hypothetical protein [Helicobacter sp. XJK30-2]
MRALRGNPQKQSIFPRIHFLKNTANAQIAQVDSSPKVLESTIPLESTFDILLA